MLKSLSGPTVPARKTAQPSAGRVALVSVHGGPLVQTGAEEAGGQNVYVREVTRALSRRGIDVDVFTRGRNHAAPEICHLEHARVIRLPAGRAGFIGRNELFPHLSEFLRQMTDFTLASGKRYDVLHSNYWLSGWVGMQYARQFGTPQVHTHHSLGAVKFASTRTIPPLGQARLHTERMLMSECAAIVATSTEDVVSMEKYYGSSGRSVVVPCGVDPALFYPRCKEESRAILGLPPAAPLLAYVGRFDREKGIETFVRAAAQAACRREIHLVLAGGYDPNANDASEFRRIRALVSELGLDARCHFLGKTGHDRLPLVYSAADLCVVPSHYESFGMVAIEAMGCGTPVVASDVGGLQYTVQHGVTGLHATSRDAGSFAEALTTLLADAPLRTRMGHTASTMVREKYTWPAVAAELCYLYQTVLDGAPTSRCG
jgi:D-inositol-3-phosphate glycosyltransferase